MIDTVDDDLNEMLEKIDKLTILLYEICKIERAYPSVVFGAAAKMIDDLLDFFIKTTGSTVIALSLINKHRKYLDEKEKKIALYNIKSNNKKKQ